MNIYSPRPWLFPKDIPGTKSFFDEHGREITFEARQKIHFGLAPKVYFIEKGLIASVAGSFCEYEKLVALFGPATTLGGVKAVLHEDKNMALLGHCIAPISAKWVYENEYRHWVFEQEDRPCQVYKNFALKNEASVEGLLYNAITPLEVRLCTMLETILEAFDRPIKEEKICLPHKITTNDLAMFVHCDRVSISHVISRWQDRGYIERIGRDLYISPSLLEVKKKFFEFKER